MKSFKKAGFRILKGKMISKERRGKFHFWFEKDGMEGWLQIVEGSMEDLKELDEKIEEVKERKKIEVWQKLDDDGVLYVKPVFHSIGMSVITDGVPEIIKEDVEKIVKIAKEKGDIAFDMDWEDFDWTELNWKTIKYHKNQIEKEEKRKKERERKKQERINKLLEGHYYKKSKIYRDGDDYHFLVRNIFDFGKVINKWREKGMYVRVDKNNNIGKGGELAFLSKDEDSHEEIKKLSDNEKEIYQIVNIITDIGDEVRL